MKQRVITAFGYVGVILVLVAIKWLEPVYGSLGFDLLFWLISVMGAYEFMRALGNEISRPQWCTTMTTCALIIPAYLLGKYLVDVEFALTMIMVVAGVGAMVTAVLLVFDFGRSSLKSTAFSLTCILYCGVLGSVGANINHMAYNSFVGVVFMFFLTAGVDTFAFIFGKLFGKFLPKKLAPHTSPNKTVIGAVGGVIGGIIAAVVAYFVCAYLPVSPYAPEGYQLLTYDGYIHPCLLLVLISIPTSICAMMGDLFESAIKRGCGIKDMGKILPGHGGILDRFDSMLFAALSVIVCFLMIV
jgi:phosphatidate cytidylyltransferase